MFGLTGVPQGAPAFFVPKAFKPRRRRGSGDPGARPIRQYREVTEPEWCPRRAGRSGAVCHKMPSQSRRRSPAVDANARLAKRQARLLREFARRQGDPNDGGQTRAGLVTAYRQDALKLAMYLFEAGASKGAHVARETQVQRATAMMRDNHYGWFEKIETGIYGLTPTGAEAVSAAGRVLGSD